MAQAAFAAKCVVHPQVFAQQSRPETKSSNVSSACLSRFVTIFSYSAKRESRVACHLYDNSSNKPSTEWKDGDSGITGRTEPTAPYDLSLRSSLQYHHVTNPLAASQQLARIRARLQTCI